MKRIKRAAAFLLAAAMMALQFTSPAFAGETAGGKGEPESLVGELCVYTEDRGQRKVDAMLYDETMILVSPQTAANLAGAELVDAGNGKFEFWRDHYVVQVDTKTKEIDIGIYTQGETVGRLYKNEIFTLREVQTAQFAKGKVTVIPLEQMLYLLNAQWVCEEDCVYVYNPPETLWNVVGDFWEMDDVLPSPAEILGDTVFKKWGNSFKYGLLAFADEVKPEYLIPIVGDDYWSLEKMKEALLTLAVPCENIMGDLREEAQKDSGKYISDIAGMVDDISTLSGGTASVVEKLTKSVTAWSDVKIPKEVSNAFTAVSFTADMAKAIAAAGRYENWGESYRDQLEYLSKMENDQYAEYCKDLNKVAGSLFKEYGDYTGNVVKETLKTIASLGADIYLGKTPVGLVFSSYDLAHTFVEAYIPAAKTAQQAGDNVSAAMRLSDLSVLMRAQYGDEIVRVAKKGTLDSIEDVAQLRFIGSLMAEASAHSYDSLYSAWKNMYLAGHSDASEEEIRQNAGESLSMDELAGKLIKNQTCITRFEETTQYDPSLLLYGNMSNLYSDTAGAHREEIPPEYVHPVIEAENNGGNVVRYLGNLYYWKYNAESFSSTGTFAYYTHMQANNQLICRHEDGSEDVLLSARGYGPIFIAGKRIYLKEDGANLFSVNLDGGDRVEHGFFEPWAADVKNGTLIGRRSYAEGGGVAVLKADHTLETITDTGYNFLGAIDGYCYYTEAEYKETSKFTLFRVTIDGSQVEALDSVTVGAGEAMGLEVCQLMKKGDTIYYSYGFYAGTGGFFQKGGINSIDVSGTNRQVCVPYGDLGAEEFLVVESGEETSLYYIGTEDGMGSYVGFWDDYPYKVCHVMTRKDGEDTWTTAQSDASLSRPGSFICVGGEILRYNEELMSYQTLIPKSAGFGFLDSPQGSEDKIALISELDIIGDDLFFTVEWSIRTEENFGWRPVYQRERSAFYTMKIGESEPVELYGY